MTTTTKIEKLTDAQKFALRNPLNTRSVLLAGAEALRIIDQLTAALKAAEHDHHEQRESRKYWEQQHGVAWERAEALQARVAELQTEVRERIENAVAEQRLRQATESVLERTESVLERTESVLERTESELATAKARVAELEREVESSDAGRDSAFDLIEQKNNELDAAHEALETAESELADLRGRVERAMQVYVHFESDLEGTTLAVALEALRGR